MVEALERVAVVNGTLEGDGCSHTSSGVPHEVVMVGGKLEEIGGAGRVEGTVRAGVEAGVVGAGVVGADGVQVPLQVQVLSLSPYLPTNSYAWRSRQPATVWRVTPALRRMSAIAVSLM